MSKQGDSSSTLSGSKKRSSSVEQACSSPSSKLRKVDDGSGDNVDVSENTKPTALNADAQGGEESKSREDDSPCGLQTREQVEPHTAGTQDSSRKHDVDSSNAEHTESNSDKREPDGDAIEAASDDGDKECRPSMSEKRSDSAAIAAAEALASLTGGNKSKGSDEMPCSSKQAASFKDVPKPGQQTEAVPADSSSSLLSRDERGDEEDAGDMDEDDSLPGSSSTPSSSLASDNDEDSECAIVSVKMAPEIRQSIAHLAQVQTQLNALEKKGARLYQRLELKLERQRRPHLDQRSAVTQTIPGFWVTALLNHPYLSPHIDENDEDALSYMTNLEIESFNKLGYRIRFHFRRNPYFQNTVIMKELHLGIGGSPVSMSNPILWHRGQNLTGPGELRRSTRGGYQSFFSWFSDHSCPGRDDIAQILKDDLYRNPLRYYLTPLWEPRENGSAPRPPANNNNDNGDECVVISDSDDDEPDESSQESRREEKQVEEEDEEEDEEEGDPVAGLEEYSYEAKEEEEVDVEEVDGSHDSGAHEGRDGGEEEEEADADEAGGEEEN
ncbi:hypothetical protein ACEWY4_001238 [Coilia grayii]|uniref:Uncharacterized protein n=1 Tax=Coilia grayii TaxID=363190 RepID=A0ABD1KYY2_9TELE